MFDASTVAAELTESLAAHMGMEVPEAETAKLDGGLHHGNAQIGRRLIEGLRPLIAEIRTSIGYFRRSNESSVIERVLLTGGGAHLTGIDLVFTEQLGVPVAVANPLQNVSVVGVDASSVPSTVSVGLAMGAAA